MGLAFNIQTVKASGTIYIRADGSVDPSTASIQRDGDRYTFTDNIYESIVVEKDNIVVDGAGYTVQGTGTEIGMNLTDTSNVTIMNMEIKAFAFGIWVYQSFNNRILGNKIANNTYGVWIFASGNTLYRNTITDNSNFGVVIDIDSSNNIISGNNITNNNGGIWLILASDNKFYYNNFVDNTPDVHIPMSGYTNLWNSDYPSGGNYWSDYPDIDLRSGLYQNVTGSDGIGDTPYTIDGSNRDNYPLMGRFFDFNATAEYHIQTICNSTISDFQYDEATVSFDITGPDETIGFCRITIPKTLMKGPFTVYVDESVVTVNELPILNTTHAFLYFKYIHSTHTVEIVSWTERYEKLLEDFQNLNSTLYDLLGNITDLQGKYDSLLTKISSMQEQVDSLNSTCQDLQESIDDLIITFNSTCENLQGQASLLNLTLQTSVSQLQEQINSLNSTFQASINALSNQLSSYSNLQAELNNIRILMYVSVATAIVLIATSVYLTIRKPKTKPKTK